MLFVWQPHRICSAACYSHRLQLALSIAFQTDCNLCQITHIFLVCVLLSRVLCSIHRAWDVSQPYVGAVAGSVGGVVFVAIVVVMMMHAGRKRAGSASHGAAKRGRGGSEEGAPMVDMETSMDNTLPPEVHLPNLPTLPSPAPTTFASPMSLPFLPPAAYCRRI